MSENYTSDKELLDRFKVLKNAKENILHLDKTYILKVISAIEYLETELEKREINNLPEGQNKISEIYQARYSMAKRALDKIADFDLYAEFGYIDEFLQAKAYEECREIAMNTIKQLNSKSK